ncbi:hypothetical protein NN4_12490 [Nocardia ninae NBRC 108245]|uniref:Uncharacterized protein n=1 Tax=Nocardia ninae NBRC 108245 TaxID=1210091 RepID=A0A511M7Y5_9NOCA|nr:hypothetical protein NN4_12490 [Nocardia ninae NBRC 108245]
MFERGIHVHRRHQIVLQRLGFGRVRPWHVPHDRPSDVGVPEAQYHRTGTTEGGRLEALQVYPRHRDSRTLRQQPGITFRLGQTPIRLLHNGKQSPLGSGQRLRRALGLGEARQLGPQIATVHRVADYDRNTVDLAESVVFRCQPVLRRQR